MEEPKQNEERRNHKRKSDQKMLEEFRFLGMEKIIPKCLQRNKILGFSKTKTTKTFKSLRGDNEMEDTYHLPSDGKLMKMKEIFFPKKCKVTQLEEMIW